VATGFTQPTTSVRRRCAWPFRTLANLAGNRFCGRQFARERIRSRRHGDPDASPRDFPSSAATHSQSRCVLRRDALRVRALSVDLKVKSSIRGRHAVMLRALNKALTPVRSCLNAASAGLRLMWIEVAVVRHRAEQTEKTGCQSRPSRRNGIQVHLACEACTRLPR
jgi:hypothetical protein